MKKVVIIVSILFIFFVIFLLIQSDNKINVELDKCVDGDTAWLRINNERKKYRFLNIDTMETETDFGLITSNYVCDLLSNANDIKVEYSSFGEKKDKYNRELVYVYIDDELLQEKLISDGYARLKYVYAKYEYLDKLIELENIAKNKKIGIWEYYKDSKNIKYNILDNPKKIGCKFIGWEYNSKLYDMTNKINYINKLKPKFDC